MLVSAREGYRRWSATYDDDPNPIVSLIDRHLDIQGSRVIDVGCGTGRRLDRGHCFGTDLSFEMLLRSDSRRIAQADASSLPFADNAADTALCILALGYMPSPRDAMIELRRIVRRGGIIIAADLHPQAIAAGWTRSFRAAGTVYEIETHPYTFNDLCIGGLTLEDSQDLYFGEPERTIYQQAGRSDLFDQVRNTPAVWMRRWRK